MSSFRLCDRHGDYFSTFPACPFCDQERVVAPAKASPPPAPIKATPAPAHRRPVLTLPRPGVLIPKRRRMSRAVFWTLALTGLSIAIVLGALFPFPAIIVLTIVAVFFLR